MRLSSSWVNIIGGGVEGTSMADLSDVMKRGSYASAIGNRRNFRKFETQRKGMRDVAESPGAELDGMGRKGMSFEKWMVMNR